MSKELTGQGKKFKALGAAVMAEIDRRLLAGESGKTVAKWLQEDAKRLVKENRSTLQKQLERYRGGELRKKTLERIAGVQSNAAITVIQARLDAMNEMERLAKEQRNRLDRLLVKEAELPKGILLKDATREIAIMKDLLVEVSKLQLETGVMVRAPKNVKGSITDPTGAVTEFEWSEEHQALCKELDEKLEAIREEG